jgi:RNA polymerase sigma factor (sigma-70 family)
MTSVLTRINQSPTTRSPLAGTPDEDLLRSFADRRDEAAERDFAELVRRHGPMVLGVCRHMLRDSHDADDAFQATFLVLARKAGSIDRPELLAHWLQGVAVRVARQARGRNDRRRRIEGQEVAMLDTEPVGDAGHQEQRLARRETAQVVHEELARLPEKYRSPVVLCDLDGLSHAEAAGRLHWPVGSLSVRLMRARDLLRERLGRRGLAPTAGLIVVASAASRPASAEVPRGLAEGTVRAAIQYSGGCSSAASAAAAALAGQVLTTMAVAKILTAVAALSLFGLATFAASLLARSGEDLPSTPSFQAAQILPIQPKTEPLDRSPARSVEEAPFAGRESVLQPALADGSGSANPPEPKTDPASKAYPALAKQAGRDADAQVRLALWCESHGLTSERLHHLTLAILRDPGHAGARGLIGQVMHQGRWRSVRDVGPLVLKDDDFSATLEAYKVRRQKAANTAEAQWKLANWCEQKGLKDEATSHVVAVTRLNPDHELARKRLGFKKINGRWVTAEQVEDELAEVAARKEGNLHWRPLLVRWKAWLDDPKHHREAEEGLTGLDDPYAVPAIWAVFASGGPIDQARAAQLLGQIDSPASTFGLAVLAVFSSSEPARRAASETLKLRDPRDAVALMVGLLLDPEPNPNTVVYRFQCLPIGALGIGSPGITLIEGQRANAIQIYTVDESLQSWNFNQLLGITSPNYERRITVQRARQAQQLEATIGEFIAQAIREVGPVRAAALQFNARVIQTLRNITGRDRGGDWEAWKRWWVESQGYAYDPGQFHNPPDLSVFEPKPTFVASSHFHLSCFGAGTPVETLTGPRPIESIQVGDRVLTRDVHGGGLEFAPVLAVFHNRPSETLRLQIGEGSVVTTGIHRFWIAGKGWVMARDLKPGDLVRTLEGIAPVRSVVSNLIQPVFNLEVGKNRSFFAGEPAALVHDNSRVEPASRPFDAVPELTISAK